MVLIRDHGESLRVWRSLCILLPSLPAHAADPFSSVLVIDFSSVYSVLVLFAVLFANPLQPLRPVLVIFLSLLCVPLRGYVCVFLLLFVCFL